MDRPSRCFAFIPARGGSKRLPRKNVLDLAGKPLIAHTIECALASGCFDTVMVSSDDDEIREVARMYDGVTFDHRAAELAGDKVRVVDVLTEICGRPDIADRYDALCVMLPTAPFRRVADLRKGYAGLTGDVDAVVAFTPYDFPPQMAVELSDGERIMSTIYDPSPLLTGNTRSQDQRQAYHPSGSFYFVWLESFRRLNSYFTGRVRGIVVDHFGIVDIDQPEDLELARVIAAAGLAASDFV